MGINDKQKNPHKQHGDMHGHTCLLNECPIHYPKPRNHAPMGHMAQHISASGKTAQDKAAQEHNLAMPPPIKNPAAVALGKLGGASKSAAKQKAARKNGKKGGRPRKKPSPARSGGPDV